MTVSKVLVKSQVSNLVDRVKSKANKNAPGIVELHGECWLQIVKPALGRLFSRVSEC